MKFKLQIQNEKNAIFRVLSLFSQNFIDFLLKRKIKLFSPKYFTADTQKDKRRLNENYAQKFCDGFRNLHFINFESKFPAFQRN